MRVEPYFVGSYVHVIKRGSRGMPIVEDDGDRWRFLLMLCHFNDEFKSDNWFRELMDEKIANTFKRSSLWPTQRKLVEINCFCLLDNHFHLLLREIKQGGISKFMQKLCGGMTTHHNSKGGEKGSLFQGAFKSRTIVDDRYLQYVSAYIQVKNPFELYPGGDTKAVKEFDKAYEWASQYPYCSLGEYAGLRESPLIDKNLPGDIFKSPVTYKEFAHDFVLGRNIPTDGYVELE